MDLLKTIEDDDEVNYASSESGSDDEAQPTKKKVKDKAKSKDFNGAFQFAENQDEYMKDTWNDIARYVKKKAKTTLDEKIAKVRKDMKKKKKDAGEQEADSDEEANAENDGDFELSDDELVRDNIRVKEKDRQRKLKRKLKMGDEDKTTGRAHG